MTIKVGKVGMVSVDSIIVSDRARKEMGDLDSLEANMRDNGLIAPLAVMDNKDGTYRLLAGERRFSVLRRNNITSIPARIYDEELSELEMKIIEKSENFFRKDMEYWEMDKLTLEIHQMQQELQGVKAPGPGQEGWSTRDTAEMLGYKSPASVVESVKRAQAREAFPELFEKCKTANDASKVLKKLDEAAIKQAIAEKLESQKASSLVSDLSKRFIIKDFFEGVKDIPDGVMHLVEIDPPYAINLADVKKAKSESQYLIDQYNEVPQSDYEHFMKRVLKECYRVMTQHSWLICWFAPHPWFEKMHSWIIGAGFETTRMVGIWTKGSRVQNNNPSIQLSNSYEMFFYAWKGRPVLNKAGRSNIFNIEPVNPDKKTHPTERPIELMKELYETFSFPGSRVLIPFLGSGNGLIAAHLCNMQGVGFELSKTYRDSFLVKVHAMSGEII